MHAADQVEPRFERLDHAATRACALAERAYLARLGASCNTPMAAHAAWSGDRLTLTAFVASEDGRKVLRGNDRGPHDTRQVIPARVFLEPVRQR